MRCLQAGALCVSMIAASVAIAAFAPGGVQGARTALSEEAQGVFPIDIAVSFGAVAAESVQDHRDAAARSAFAFSNPRLANGPGRPASREVYVIVIGETSRRENWSLFGYARATNPRLEEIRDHLVLFERMNSNATNTILSLPMALTRASPSAREPERSEKSIVTLLKQAGFATYWISNQERPSLASSSINQIASEADHVSFSDFDQQDMNFDPLDSNLITRFDDVMASLPPTAKAVIFLHMEGSHFSYKARYPVSFAAFPDNLRPPRVLPERQARLTDEYDNSILFTDHNVRSVIDGLAACQCRAGLIFFSDHGERLFDNGLGDTEFGHGFPLATRQEVEIPFFLWLSDEYQNAAPELLARAKANAAKPAELHDLFETIVDLAGVTYDHRSPALSLFSGDWQPLTRLQVLGLNEQVETLPVSTTARNQSSGAAP